MSNNLKGICHDFGRVAFRLRRIAIINQPELDRDCQITRGAPR
jgi:hypothetical protein